MNGFGFTHLGGVRNADQTPKQASQIALGLSMVWLIVVVWKLADRHEEAYQPIDIH